MRNMEVNRYGGTRTLDLALSHVAEPVRYVPEISILLNRIRPIRLSYSGSIPGKRLRSMPFMHWTATVRSQVSPTPHQQHSCAACCFTLLTHSHNGMQLKRL